MNFCDIIEKIGKWVSMTGDVLTLQKFGGSFMDNNNAGSAAGSLRVSSNVLISIAEAAAAEVEGVALNSLNKLAVVSGAPVTSMVVPPIKVKLDGDSAAIDISIITLLGSKAYDVAKSVQEHVKSAVQNMTGIAVSKVNVRVVGVKNK